MPLIFLDFDDVICLNNPYGGYDVARAAYEVPEPDLWDKLFHRPSVRVLLAMLQEHKAQVVITSSWLRFLDRDGIDTLLERTGLAPLKNALHPQWDAPQNRHETRLSAIERWLAANHRGEAFIVLDDTLSGAALVDSHLDKDGRVVWCVEGVGLTSEHSEKVRSALMGQSER
ncbi:MAG TPA: HAD domain-containing protein [Candidatus Paceibacterota bacterium]|nr:HAD domain-containing protein [Candidatus Paceibacterota bacterium]